MRLMLFFPLSQLWYPLYTLHDTQRRSLSSLSHVLMGASLRTHAFTLLQLVHLAVSATLRPISTLA